LQLPEQFLKVGAGAEWLKFAVLQIGDGSGGFKPAGGVGLYQQFDRAGGVPLDQSLLVRFKKAGVLPGRGRCMRIDAGIVFEQPGALRPVGKDCLGLGGGAGVFAQPRQRTTATTSPPAADCSTAAAISRCTLRTKRRPVLVGSSEKRPLLRGRVTDVERFVRPGGV